MNKIQLGIDAISTTPIRIGFEGENVHTQVTFFWTVLRSKYPDAVASLSIKPPVGDIYPKSVTQDGNKVVWDVTASDTANPGSGEYQLTFTDGEEIIKTYIGNFTVNDSIIGDGEAPDPIQDWVADANAVLGELSEISASVTTLEAGESATVEVTEVGGHKNLAFGIPAGEKGEQGEPGDPAPAEEVIPAVNAYLAEVITNPDSPPLDRTLSSSSAAAPADMVGDLKSAMSLNTQIRTPTYDDDKAISISTSVPLQSGEYKTVGVANDMCGFWIDCVEGDEFVITGSVGNLVPWAFIGDFTSSDTSVDVITSGAKNSTFSKRTITAPSGAKHVIIQLLSSSNPVVISIENSFNARFKDDENLVFNTVGRARVNIPASWAQGNINPDGSTTNPTSSSTRCASNGFIVGNQFNDIRSLEINIPNGLEWRVTFWKNEDVKTTNLISTDSNTNWQKGYYSCAVPNNAVYAAISVRKPDNGSITPSALTGSTLYLLYGTYLGNAFQGKRISILGDSISTYAGENASTDSDGHLIADGTYTYAGNHCRYPTSYMSNVNSAYWKKLIDELGMALGINDSWAGSRVSWNGSATGSDDNSNACISSQTRIDHLGENGTPDYILVNAGTNDIGATAHKPPVGTFNTENPVNYTDQQIADMSDPSKAAFCVGTFAGAYRTMLIRLQKKYPLARIVVMLPNYTTSYYNPTEADEYLEIIKEACDYFGIPWVDMRTTGVTMYNTATYLGDGIHPNVAGMSALANKVLKFFEYSL